MLFRRLKFGFSIGTDRVFRADVRSKGKGFIVHSGQAAVISPGVIQPSPSENNILDPDAYRTACHALMTRQSKGARYYLSLPENCVRLMVLDFKQLPKDASDREQLICWQMAQAFLAPHKPAHLTFQKLGKKNGLRRILAMTIQKDILFQYEAPFRENGMEPACIGILPVHLFNLYHPLLLEVSSPDRQLIYIVIHDGALTLFICRGGVVDFVRVKQLTGFSSCGKKRSPERILREIGTSISRYRESENHFNLSHIFMTADVEFSEFDLQLKEQFGIAPNVLPAEKAGYLMFHHKNEMNPHEFLAASSAVAGGLS